MTIKIWHNIKPEFADERGDIIKILDDGKTNIKSAVLITCTKGSIRANHYHKRDTHYVYMLKGSMEYTETDMDGKNRQTAVVKKGDLVYTPSLKPHAMKFLEESEFLTLATESRHQEAYENDIVKVKVI